ncbi:hypothetical protein IFR05_007050 [Cadophora sp. M221]|nr:hypothetical protein IFR05_007050 [Cadophora sp. M221]
MPSKEVSGVGSYNPIYDKDNCEVSRPSSDADDSDDLLRKQCRSLNTRSWLFSLRDTTSFLAVLACLASYTVIVAAIVLTWSHQHAQQRCQRTSGSNVYPSTFQTQLNDYVEYVPRHFTQNEHGYVKFFGKPSPEIDANWHQILAPQNIGVSPEHMEELGRLDEGIQLSDGNYFGSLTVYHHLHCLKNLYHAVHPEYYGLANLTSAEQETQEFHVGNAKPTVFISFKRQ